MVCFVRHGILFALLAVFVKDAYFASLPEEDVDNIAHGRQAKDGEFPFQVALLLKSSGQLKKFCGGAIISESVILTAAHCVENHQSSYLVRAGVNDLFSPAGQDRSIQRIVMHPGFGSSGFEHDVALIKLSQPLQFNAKVNKIGLNSQKVPAGTTCTIIGWGAQEPGSRVSERMLKTGTVKTQTQSNPNIIKLAMRHGDDAVCGGDSGGPMVCNGRVAGINSFIASEKSDCPPDIAQAFASVDNYYTWINQNMP